MADQRLVIRPFEKALHNRRAFSSGIDAMDIWLRESIGDQIKLNRLRVWCATEASGTLVGYYALAMHSVQPDAAPELARKKERHPIPSIYLAALAVDLKHQGKGVGRALLGDAIHRCVRVSDEIGAAAIILDVLKDDRYDQRRAFYASLGFAELGSGDPARLFLSIEDARASMATVG